jgi:hypothetical protein
MAKLSAVEKELRILRDTINPPFPLFKFGFWITLFLMGLGFLAMLCGLARPVFTRFW